MLDVNTRNRINAARDILVGKVPDPKSQVEQITIALIYKFMDDMDAEAEELGGKRTFFTGKYSKYGWRKIFDPKLSGFEMLSLYSEAIQQMNLIPTIPQLFRDIFKNAYLPYRDPETLKAFLKVINEFNYDHSERLGDAFEFLLSVLGSQGDAGQFRTPRHIIDFMVRIADPKKNERVLDPACGTAGFLISSYKHILKQNSKEGKAGRGLTTDDRKKLVQQLRGYDISPDMVRLSLVNMYLHGFTQPNIIEYDTLTSEERWNEYYDVVMANPPFMSPKGGIRPHKRFSVQSNRSEVLFVDYIAEHLTPNGRAAVIVPEGIIFQSGTAYKALRKMLVENYLWAVVSLPAGVFQPYSGVKTSILLMDKTLAKKSDSILFVKVQNDGFDLGAQRRAIDKSDLYFAEEVLKYYGQHSEVENFDVAAAIRNGSGINKVDHEVNEVPIVKVEPCQYLLVQKNKIAVNGDYILSGDKYKESGVNLVSNYEAVALNDLCRIQSGFPFDSKLFNEDTGFPLIRIRDIKPNSTTTRYNGEVLQDYVVQNGDLIIGMDGEFNCTIWKGGPALLNQRVCKLYDFKGSLKEYVVRFIQQKLKEIENNTHAVTVKHISNKQILGIKIPLPPLSIQQQIVDEIDGYQKVIDGARQVVENYKPTIRIDPDWEMVELGDLVTIQTGGTPSKSNHELWNGEIPWVSPKDMKQDLIGDSEDRISEIAVKNSSTKIVPEKTILVVVRSGILKHTIPIALTTKSVSFNQDIIAIQPVTKSLLPEYLFYYLKSTSNIHLNEGIKPGVTVQSFHNGYFRKIKIPLPPVQIQLHVIGQLEKERAAVDANRELIEIFTNKIKYAIAQVWGEEREQKEYVENEEMTIAEEV